MAEPLQLPLFPDQAVSILIRLERSRSDGSARSVRLSSARTTRSEAVSP